MTEMYVSLGYEEYKHFEEQLKDYQKLETTHESMDRRFYHRAFRLKLGDLTLEVHGPSVRGPSIEDPQSPADDREAAREAREARL